MGTFASIKARVATRIIDLPTAVSAEVGTLVNEAIRSLETDHNFKVMETETTINTTLSTRGLGAVPADFKEYRGDPYILRFSGSTKDLVHSPQVQDVLDLLTNVSTGEPSVLFDPAPDDAGVRTWHIYPLPDGLSDFVGGEYRVHIPYWRYLPDLTADGGTNWFTVNAEEYIVSKATANGFAIDWDADREVLWAQKAENEKGKIIKRDKMYALSKVDTWVPMWRGVKQTRLKV